MNDISSGNANPISATTITAEANGNRRRFFLWFILLPIGIIITMIFWGSIHSVPSIELPKVPTVNINTSYLANVPVIGILVGLAVIALIMAVVSSLQERTKKHRQHEGDHPLANTPGAENEEKEPMTFWLFSNGQLNQLYMVVLSIMIHGAIFGTWAWFLNKYLFPGLGGPGYWLPKLLIWLPLLLSISKCFVRVPSYHRASVFLIDFPMFHNMPNGIIYIPFYGLFEMRSIACNREPYTPGQEGIGPSAKNTPFKVAMRDVGEVIIDLTFEVTPYHTGRLFKFKGDTPDSEFKKKLEERFVDRVNAAASLYVNSRNKDGQYVFSSIDEIIGTQARASNEIMSLAKGLIEAAGGILNTVIVKDLGNADPRIRAAAQSLAARKLEEAEEELNLTVELGKMKRTVESVKEVFGEDTKINFTDVTDFLATQDQLIQRIRLDGSGAKNALPIVKLGEKDRKKKRGN